MKLRCDFVTNSSSSCYVAMILRTKDGRTFSGGFVGDCVTVSDNCLAFNSDLSLQKALSLDTVGGLLSLLDETYDGLFSHYQELDTFFEDDENGFKSSMIRDMDLTAALGEQESIASLPMSAIESVEIHETFSADEGSGGGSLKLDLPEQIEHITSTLNSDEYFSEYEAVRHLDTGEVTVIRSESGEAEYDEECEEEYNEDDEWDEDDECDENDTWDEDDECDEDNTWDEDDE